MLKNLFKPVIVKNNLYQFLIGYQRLIIIEINDTKNSIIINKLLSKLLLIDFEMYFFDSFEEMENDFDELLNFTDNSYIVIIN